MNIGINLLSKSFRLIERQAKLGLIFQIFDSFIIIVVDNLFKNIFINFHQHFFVSIYFLIVYSLWLKEAKIFASDVISGGI